MTAQQAIQIARKHFIAMNGKEGSDSALLCLSDAIALQEKGESPVFVKGRAVKSLAYSVGAFHRDYKRVQASIDK